MTYSKKKYLQFLKSCGIVSAGCAFYACNQGNDSFDNKQNDEKISSDEILTIVNEKLNSEFTNINKEEVLKFFNDNITLFQNNDSLITDFFSSINGNSELLNEFITGKNNIAIWICQNLENKAKELKAKKEDLMKKNAKEIILQINELQTKLQTLQKEEDELKEEKDTLNKQKAELRNKENELKQRKNENSEQQKECKNKIKQLEAFTKVKNRSTQKKEVDKTPNGNNKEEETINNNTVEE